MTVASGFSMVNSFNFEKKLLEMMAFCQRFLRKIKHNMKFRLLGRSMRILLLPEIWIWRRYYVRFKGYKRKTGLDYQFQYTGKR